MAIQAGTQAITGKQEGFLKRLIEERDATHVSGFTHETILNVGTPGTFVSKQEASDAITELLTMPRKGGEETDGEPLEEFDPDTLEMGVYEVGAEVYIVKRAKQSRKNYAKRMVAIGGDRLTEADTEVKIDFEYAPGAIRTIRPHHKMTLERARELSVRYGKCIRCGKHLKAAKSVRQMIGPVCIQYFS